MSRPIDYDRIAPTYDSARSWHRHVSEKILEVAGLTDDADEAPILEIGCGTGNATAELEALVTAPIIGLDFSAGMLRQASNKLSRVRLLRADAQQLPVAQRTFRMVLAVMMIHHVPDRDALFAGCARALSTGSSLVLVTTGHDQIRGHFMTRFFPSFADLDVARFPDIPIVRSELERAGFVEIDSCSLMVAANTPSQYLEKVRRKHLSTFLLMSDAEYSAGLESLASFVDGAADDKPIQHHGTVIWGRIPEA